LDRVSGLAIQPGERSIGLVARFVGRLQLGTSGGDFGSSLDKFLEQVLPHTIEPRDFLLRRGGECKGRGANEQ